VGQEQQEIWIPVRISDSFVDWEGVWELAGEEQEEEWDKVRVAAVADRARGALSNLNKGGIYHARWR
jgi:hypothetical protein